jgi:uncharacterized protein YgiM (DUF1202 family)
MQKIIFILLLIGCLFAEKMITANACNMRKDHLSKAEKIIVVPAGEEVEVIELFGDYKKVEVLSGDHTGKIGFMWQALIIENEKETKVGKLGGCLRDKPKDGDVIAKVGKGKKLKIIETIVTWYKVKYKDKEGWIYKSSLAHLDN